MQSRSRLWHWVGTTCLATTLACGCATRHVHLPCGELPSATGPADFCTADALGKSPSPQTDTPSKPDALPSQPGDRKPFDLPPDLPGANAPPIEPPRFKPDTTAAERERAIRERYPMLVPAQPTTVTTGQPISLAELQRMAMENSPLIRRAQADAEASMGAVVQAGLHPNPTVGYQADQWHFHLDNGQQGAFINQIIKFPGKLTLAQRVAGFDYLNNLVAVRRAQVDVIQRVRTAYFSALVAQKGVEVNRALSDLGDEVYQLQLKQLRAGEAAGYEPLQLYAQAMQARNAMAQSEATLRAARRQLAASIGIPDLPLMPLLGQVDAEAPVVDPIQARSTMLTGHTDLLSARNTLRQAEVNLILQQRTPYPDLQANASVQYDNTVQNMQIGLQIGMALPLFDRNPGAIRQAQWQISRATEDLFAKQNDLMSQLADALSRYEANRVAVENYRKKIIPSLTQAYRAMVRRYQAEPDKVGFNDIVVAQQNLSQAMQSYLTALDAQWRALADLASLTQQEELFPCPPPQPVGAEKPRVPDK